MKIYRIILAFICIGLSFADASAKDNLKDKFALFSSACKLEQEGKSEEAFLVYMSIPGAEHAALSIARNEPSKYLKILKDNSADLPIFRTKLLEGDMLLAKGEKEKALACYREVVKGFAKDKNKGWKDGVMPQDYYPVEISKTRNFGPQLLAPFSFGPGSHRDNWLIRRFIGLGAMEDAAKEFKRIWGIYRQSIKPHVISQKIHNENGKLTEQLFLVKPTGYNGRGLQFAVDYAYFLKRNKSVEKALDLLLDPLLKINMDKNPNLSSRRKMKPVTKEEAAKYPIIKQSQNLSPVFANNRVFNFGTSSGISRKEFIRLTYGTFKDAVKEKELVKALHKNIDDGNNKSRRVLACIRLNQNQPEEALKLELDYIKSGKFDSLSATYRRGLIYEKLQKLKEAAKQYEKLLSIPQIPEVEINLKDIKNGGISLSLPQTLETVKLDIPDPDEDITQRRIMSQAAIIPNQLLTIGTTGTAIRSDIVKRLQRIYSALGDKDKLLKISLLQFELNPIQLDNFDLLKRTAERFTTAGKKQEFLKWVSACIKKDVSRYHRANLYWLLGETDKTAEALAEAIKNNRLNYWQINEWKERFKKKGKGQLKKLLQTIVKASPNDSRLRMELLDLEDNPDSKEFIKQFEKLLETDASYAFTRGKGVYNRTKFRNYYDLAYRLMRLYEKEKQTGKLIDLGMRIAKGEKPFDKWWADNNQEQYTYRDENKLPEDVNAALSLLIQYADGEKLNKLESLWKNLPDCSPVRQVKRKLRKSFDLAKESKTFAWSNIPEGVELLTSNENVLSMTYDAKHVYVGHPWGVAVYDLKGNLIIKVPMATSALHLEICGGKLWVGTPVGLNCIVPETWKISYLPMNLDLPEKKRKAEDRPFQNGVCGLAADGKYLWIGTRRNIQRFNIEDNSLTIFSQADLQVDSHNDWELFVLDDDYVWAGGDEECRRFDRKQETWSKVLYGRRPVALMTAVDGKLFGNVNLGEPLRDRPCIIDRDTLKITPLLIEGNLTRDQRCINGPFSYYGKLKGQLVFGADHPAYVFNEKRCKLKFIGMPWDRKNNLIESPIPKGLRSGEILYKGRDYIYCDDDTTHRHKVMGRPFIAGTWSMLTLPDGTKVLGGKHSYSPRYIYPHEDWPFESISHERSSDSGGVYFIKDGKIRRVSSQPSSNSIKGDAVFAVVDDQKNNQVWLCTECGISLLDYKNNVLANLERIDGLCSNRVTSGSVLADKIYFSAGWGDHGGGLIVYDPETFVFTGRYQSDGLATDKLDSIKKKGDKIKLLYDVEYGRSSGFNYRLYPDGVYDPVSDVITPGGEARIMTQNEAGKLIMERHPKGSAMPYLGGSIIKEYSINGKKYICGTRGVMITRDDVDKKLSCSELKVTLKKGKKLQLLDEAAALRTRKAITDDELKKLLKHDNPYVMADALPAMFARLDDNREQWIPFIEEAIKSPCYEVRTTAVFDLTRVKDDFPVKYLEQALKDKDSYIRSVAAISLAKRGKVQALSYFTEMISGKVRYSNFPYKSYSSVGVIAGKEYAYKALAPHADAAMFKLFLEYPISTDDYEPRNKIFEALGKSVLKNPESIKVLLKAYNKERDFGPETNYGATRFAQQVFKYAGKGILPELHKALRSKDRVVRSNAARACGAIKDPSSIEPLLKALDLESGLSRASIVWALGELKAKQALPKLADLYVDAQNDEKRRRGFGFRTMQVQAEIQSQFNSFRNLDSVGSDWNELKEVSSAKPVNPRRNEWLLSTEIVLNAVRKIGPDASQDFYRKLAGGEDPEARKQAAECLAEGKAKDREKNLPILQNLLSDKEERVQVRAAVSLLKLDDKSGQKIILQWLKGRPWQKRLVLTLLEKVKNPDRLSFAKKEIITISKDKKMNSYSNRHIKKMAEELLKKM